MHVLFHQKKHCVNVIAGLYYWKIQFDQTYTDHMTFVKSCFSTHIVLVSPCVLTCLNFQVLLFPAATVRFQLFLSTTWPWSTAPFGISAPMNVF